MTHLLDTDVIVNHIRKIEQIELPKTTQLAISIISHAELLYGTEKTFNPKKIGRDLEVVISKLAIRIINLDYKIIKLFAHIKVNLEKSGERLEDFDLLIAATALEHDLILVTANYRHFSRIPKLKLA